MIALVELKGTSMESAHYGIAHFFMELYAVKGEILVFFFGIGDAGIELSLIHISEPTRPY